MDFIEACRRFIAVDSTPASGTVDVAALAKKYCEDMGLFVTLQEGVINGIAQTNLIARPVALRPDKELLLQSHLDTAEPGSYSLWTETDRNPFNATIRNNKIYGLGAASAKIDFICKLKAIHDLKNLTNWKLPFALVGTFGEEIGMWGARRLMQGDMVSSDCALIGEPTGMRPVGASNGLAVVEFFVPFLEEEKKYRLEHEQTESTATHSRIFRGKSAHSSQPQSGESAILKMIRYLDELPETITVLNIDGGISHNTIPDQAFLEVDMGRSFTNGVGKKTVTLINELETLAASFLEYKAPDFSPPHPTFNVGVIRTYEDGVQIISSLRWTPNVPDEVLQTWRQRIKLFCHTLGARVRIREFKPPTHLDQNHMFSKHCLESLRELHLTPEVCYKTTANESSVYCSYGVSSVVIGPGENNSHSPNEHSNLVELEGAVAFYKSVLKRMCL